MTIAPHTATAIPPLTAAQKGLLIGNRTVPVPHLYNILSELELDPALSTATVASAPTAVPAVQPARRLGIQEGADPNTVLGDVPDDAPLRVVTTDRAAYEHRRGELLADLGKTAFGLTRPPLLRAVLLRSDDDTRSTLLTVVHHLVFDGFSSHQSVRDLTAATRQTLDVEAVLVVRERALRRELEAQLTSADDEKAERAATAPAGRLRATPATVLNLRPKRPAATTFAGTRHEIQLSAQYSADLDALCVTLGVSPFVLFSAAHAALPARHKRQHGRGLGQTGHGPPHPGLLRPVRILRQHPAAHRRRFLGRSVRRLRQGDSPGRGRPERGRRGGLLRPRRPPSQEAGKRAQELGFTRLDGSSLSILSLIQVRLGRFEEAVEPAERAVGQLLAHEIDCRMELRHGEACVLWGHARTAEAQGNAQLARQHRAAADNLFSLMKAPETAR